MEIKQLKIFMTVCEYMNFTETAKVLNYAQSSISEAISTLEKNLEVKLFERLGNKIYLTEKGFELKEYGHRLLQLYDETLHKLNNTQEEKIKIGITETLCSYKFPGFFKTFLEEHKGVTIQFDIVRCEDISKLLRTNRIDIGFTLDERMVYPDLETIRLFDEEIVFVGPSGNKVFELDHQNVIIPKGDTGYLKYFHDVYQENGYIKGATIHMESMEGIKSYVKSGFGISFIPVTTISKEVEEGSISIYRVPEQRFFHEVKILIHKQKHMTKSLSSLIESAVEIYSK